MSRFAIWLWLLPAASWADGVVTTPTEASLRAALGGGGKVTFACDGTVTLAGTITNYADTLLDGTGHQVTISGGDAVRVFVIQSNSTLRLHNVTIARGRSTNHGGAILNDYGTVIATQTIFTSNSVTGLNGPLWPGLAPGGSATGGAIANFGAIQIINCTFIGNSAIGGDGSSGVGGTVGEAGGFGAGGAVWSSGSLAALGCTLYKNVAAGGKGGAGGPGFPVPWPNPGYPGGSGGDGSGAGLFNSGNARIVNCTLALNRSLGGAGGPGGPGYPHPDYPPPDSGPDGAAGLGTGGLYDASGMCTLMNCSLVDNTGTGIATPPAGGSLMSNTLLQGNTPLNASGTLVDLGHNLSSDSSCNFTNIGSRNSTFAAVGPLTNNGGPTLTVALLPESPAIDAGDPAVNLPTDQRGFPRPAGAALDVGACEFGSVLPTLGFFRGVGGELTLIGFGNAGQSCRLLTSPDLTRWSSTATNHFSTSGSTSFQLETSSNSLFYRLAMP